MTATADNTARIARSRKQAWTTVYLYSILLFRSPCIACVNPHGNFTPGHPSGALARHPARCAHRAHGFHRPRNARRRVARRWLADRRPDRAARAGTRHRRNPSAAAGPGQHEPRSSRGAAASALQAQRAVLVGLESARPAPAVHRYRARSRYLVGGRAGAAPQLLRGADPMGRPDPGTRIAAAAPRRPVRRSALLQVPSPGNARAGIACGAAPRACAAGARRQGLHSQTPGSGVRAAHRCRAA